jgi:hypothetical protein
MFDSAKTLMNGSHEDIRACLICTGPDDQDMRYLTHAKTFSPPCAPARHHVGRQRRHRPRQARSAFLEAEIASSWPAGSNPGGLRLSGYSRILLSRRSAEARISVRLHRHCRPHRHCWDCGAWCESCIRRSRPMRAKQSSSYPEFGVGYRLERNKVIDRSKSFEKIRRAVTPDDFRRLALSQPGVVEKFRKGRSDFWVWRQSFASLECRLAL